MDLGKIDIFKTLTEKEINRLLLFTQKRRVKSNEKIFSRGEKANSLYIVEEGLFQVVKGSTILGNIGKGGMIGEMAIFQEKHKRTATVVALTDSILLVISSFAIEKLSKEHNEIYEKIKKIIKERQKLNKI